MKEIGQKGNLRESGNTTQTKKLISRENMGKKIWVRLLTFGQSTKESSKKGKWVEKGK